MEVVNSSDPSVWLQAQRFEHKCFRDLTLQDRRIVNRLAKIQYDDGSTEIVDPQEPGSLSIVHWKFRIADLGRVCQNLIEHRCMQFA
jgi:hypothetical protein